MFFLYLFGIVLLPKAFTLKCYECSAGDASGSCTGNVKECPSSVSQCAAMKLLTYKGNSKLSEINRKECAAEPCKQGSINFGVSRTVITSKCCDTDLCNSQPAPEPTKSNPNGKKCFRCDGQGCNGTLNCDGNEVYCVSSTVTVAGTMMTMKGCATETMCSRSLSEAMTETIGVELDCCQGDYCNSASSTRAGLLLLVAPVVSLVMLS